MAFRRWSMGGFARKYLSMYLSSPKMCIRYPIRQLSAVASDGFGGKKLSIGIIAGSAVGAGFVGYTGFEYYKRCKEVAFITESLEQFEGWLREKEKEKKKGKNVALFTGKEVREVHRWLEPMESVLLETRYFPSPDISRALHAISRINVLLWKAF